MKNLRIPLLFIIFFLFITNPVTVQSGALNGLTLWIYTIIPTLLPFILLSNLMTVFNAFDNLSAITAPITKPLLGISKSANYAVIIGFLCGYPLGAKAVCDLVCAKKISIAEAEYLLGFCNNISPIFIISYVVGFVLKTPEYTAITIIIIETAQILTALSLRIFFKSKPAGAQNDSADISSHGASKHPADIFDICIVNSFYSLLKLGGYIIVFSIIGGLLLKYIKLPEIASGSILCINEITSGLNYVAAATFPFKYKYVAVCVFSSFGGICGIFQTKSILGNTNLSVLKYTACKLISAAYCFILSSLAVMFMI